VSTLTRTDVGAVDDFPEDGITAIQLDGHDVVVIRQGGAFFALPDRCTHARYPLNDAELLDGKIKCAHHGATFELSTGKATLPAVKKIRLYEVEVVDGRVMVAMQEA
jgi:3-phenylpropionate/trans-cinnamate dioxygenase ferredoxin component